MAFANKAIEFYKQSLKMADNEVKTLAQNKALKDSVGAAYESHRKRVWEHFGFEVSKDRHDAAFRVDWSITYKGALIALEEDKGHYLDSCSLDRAFASFTKTVNTYKKKNKTVPVLILHSFTRYKKFSEKLEDLLDILGHGNQIKDEINKKKKLVYITLVESDRLPKKKWFSKEEYRYDCYYTNASDKLIIEDIKFIQSLILDFE